MLVESKCVQPAVITDNDGLVLAVCATTTTTTTTTTTLPPPTNPPTTPAVTG